MKKTVSSIAITIVIAILVALSIGKLYEDKKVAEVKDQKVSLALSERQLVVAYDYVNVRREDSLSRFSHYDDGIIGQLKKGSIVYPTGKIAYRKDYKGNKFLDWWLEVKWYNNQTAWINVDAVDEEIKPYSSEFENVQPDLSGKFIRVLFALFITLVVEYIIIAVAIYYSVPKRKRI